MTAAPRPLRVLVVHRYFWPDTPPYASMLRDIAERWAEDGHAVDVLSTQPSYKPGSAIPRRPRVERVGRLRVRRVGLLREHGRRAARLLNVAWFPVRTALAVLLRRRPYDVVMTSTVPPVLLAGLTCRAARARGGRFVYHCMDIHPEIGRISGDFANPLLYRLLLRVDRATCRRAAAVVVLSTDMAASVRRRGSTARTVVVNNFELGARADGAHPSAPGADGRLRIVFTGNVGRFQGLETVLDALGRTRAPVSLTIMGEGASVGALREQAAGLSGAPVTFLPHGDVAAARALIASADLGLVSLTSGIYRYAYPSKTMTYLAEGCPVLAVLEPDAELADLLRRDGLGVTAPAGDADALAAVLDRLSADPDELGRIRETARRCGPAAFDKSATLEQWSELLETVAAGAP